MTDFQKSIRSKIRDHFTKNRALLSNERGTSRKSAAGLPGTSGSSERSSHELEFRLGNFFEDNRTQSIKFSPKIEFDKFKQIIGTLRRLQASEAETSASKKYPQNLRVVEQKGKDSDLTLDINLIQTKFLPQHLIEARGTVPSSQIQSFCLTSTIPNLEVKSALNKTNIPDWNLRLQSSMETPVNDVTVKSQFAELVADPRYQKHYRLKKRRSFLGPGYRVDATIVKESSGSTYELSNIYNADEHYEIEIESNPDVLLSDIPENDIEALTNKYYDTVIGILEVIKSAYDDSTEPVSEIEKRAVVLDYTISFFPKKDREEAPKNLRPRRYFIGMEVNPLDTQNVGKNPQGDVSILDGSYYVTMKADGARNILYFPVIAKGQEGEGRGYLIDRDMSVRYSGLVRKDLVGAAFDGEYIDDTNEYLIFDYLMEPGGKDIRNLKFSERLKRLKSLKDIPSTDLGSITPKKKIDPMVQDEHKPGEEGLITPTGPMKLKQKEHYYIPKNPNKPNDFTVLKDILEKIENSNTYKDYKRDGFIFTPDEAYPIASLNPKVQVKWPRNLKWKPIEALSNDFLVRKVPVTAGDQFQTLKLLAGYPGGPSLFKYPLNFTDGVDNVARVRIDPDGQIRTDEGQIIYDDSVVEFTWGPLPEKAFPSSVSKNGWIPLRVREDKSRTKTPNRIDTVISNWKLIQSPITMRMLKGEEAVPSHYYLDVDEKLKKITQGWRDFHNLVKSDLITGAAEAIRAEEKNPNAQIRILDLGVGRGGDIGKWGAARARSVLGIDSARNGIEEDRHKLPIGYKVELDFIWGDVSKNINNLDAAYNDTYKKALEKALERNAPGFNIVSIMFAIHYFMKNEELINGLFKNISELMVPGGYLIGTTLDGSKVLKAFEDAKSNVLVGIEPNRKIDVWRLTKDFKSTPFEEIPGSPDAEFVPGPLGRKIKVKLISIGQEIPEYLVDFDYLTQIAAKYGLEPVVFGAFKEDGEFSDYESPTLGTLQLIKGAAREKKAPRLTDIDKRYNDLNRYFIFKKTSDTPSVLQRYVGVSKPTSTGTTVTPSTRTSTGITTAAATSTGSKVTAPIPTPAIKKTSVNVQPVKGTASVKSVSFAPTVAETSIKPVAASTASMASTASTTATSSTRPVAAPSTSTSTTTPAVSSKQPIRSVARLPPKLNRAVPLASLPKTSEQAISSVASIKVSPETSETTTALVPLRPEVEKVEASIEAVEANFPVPESIETSTTGSASSSGIIGTQNLVTPSVVKIQTTTGSIVIPVASTDSPTVPTIPKARPMATPSTSRPMVTPGTSRPIAKPMATSGTSRTMAKPIATPSTERPIATSGTERPIATPSTERPIAVAPTTSASGVPRARLPPAPLRSRTVSTTKEGTTATTTAAATTEGTTSVKPKVAAPKTRFG